jgi:uncharacterized protein (TIGR00730 family)
MKSVVVYCGANKGNLPIFEEHARQLGVYLAQSNIEVVFGGGSVGLMGVLADAVLSHDGKIRGIITNQLSNLEVGHQGVADMRAVETMSERKTLLLKDTDGVITMPGGYGSMDELFEALCLAQLQQYPKPIAILNTIGFYDPLLAMIDQMVAYGFVTTKNRALCIIDQEVAPLIAKMRAFEHSESQKWI